MCREIKALTASEAGRIIAGKRVMILCHYNPDGDAVGSSFGMAELVRLSGGEGTVVTPNPIPERLRFISGDADTSYVQGMESEYDVIVAVDTASVTQLGDLGFLAEKVALSVDHHASCTVYSPYLLDPAACAAAEVILTLAEAMYADGLIKKKSPVLYRRLYTAMASDSGNFRYSNTTAKTLEAAAACLCGIRECGDGTEKGRVLAPIDEISASDVAVLLFDRISRDEIKIRRLTYDNARYVCDGRVILSYITGEQMEAAGVTSYEDLGAMPDLLRSVEGTVAGVSIKPSKGKDGEYRVSLRSNCDFDVSAIAARFGGGGHVRAAGLTLTADSVETAVGILEAAINEQFAKGTVK